MRIFAHRGNLDGISPHENHPDLVRAALAEGFGVEIDLWQVDGGWLLGHDGPTFPIDLAEFDRDGVVFHLKSPHVPDLARADAFAIVNDPYVLTRRGWLWTNYGETATPQAIVCSPELVGNDEPLDAFVGRSSAAYGICTDYPRRVRDILDGLKR